MQLQASPSPSPRPLFLLASLSHPYFFSSLKLRLHVVTKSNEFENFLFLRRAAIFLAYFVSFFLLLLLFLRRSMPFFVPLWPCWRAGVGFSVKSPYYCADEAKQPIARAACLRICVQSERANQHSAVWLQ